ncbi:MAG: ABC transporter ATP-binding protein [Clostridiales bacterium]|nr:ABC transporter ATP-binding protein [Clostridiales bacterium]
MKETKKAEIKKQLTNSFYHKNHFAVAVEVAVAIGVAVMSVAVSWVTQKLMDTASMLPGSSPLSQLTIAAGVLTLFFIGLQLVDYHAKPRFVRRAMKQYKDLAFRKMTEKNISSFRMENTATYLSAFSNDATAIENGYLIGTLDIINQVVNFVGALALMLWYSPLMTLIAVAITIIPLTASLLTGKKLIPAEKKVSERNVEYTSTLSDCLNGFAVVKSFRAEKEVRELFEKKNQELEQDKFGKLRVLTKVNAIGWVTGTIAQLGVFVVGAYLAITGRGLTAGIVLAFVNLMNNILGPIGRLPKLLAGRKAAKALVDKLAGALAANTETTGKEELSTLKEGIRLENVRFAYEEGNDVLKGVDAFFEAGKSYAIVGGSGSGKSTLLNLLMAGSMEYQGNIRFDNTDLKESNTDSLYGMISMIQQNVFVFDASIRDNVTMFREFPKAELDDAMSKAHLSELLASRGEEYRCGENGKGLSGGEKQRISIARSLLRKSSVLLVDEATAALDADTAFHVTQDILDLSDVTRIVVTHSLEENLLRRYDGIFVLRNGRIEESGTFDDLMEKNGYFHALYTVAQ